MAEKPGARKVNGDVAATEGPLFKLIIFSLTLGLLPIASYFLSLKYLWKENATFAAITAIVIANVVLVSYIITAVRDDREKEIPNPQTESKKDL